MGGDRGDDGALDTLTALEQEALFIPRNDLDDFEQIGEGWFKHARFGPRPIVISGELF